MRICKDGFASLSRFYHAPAIGIEQTPERKLKPDTSQSGGSALDVMCDPLLFGAVCLLGSFLGLAGFTI